MMVEITSLDIEHVTIYEVLEGLYKLVISTEHGNIEISVTRNALDKIILAIEELRRADE